MENLDSLDSTMNKRVREPVGKILHCVVFEPILEPFQLRAYQIDELESASHGLPHTPSERQKFLSAHTASIRRDIIEITESFTMAQAIVKGFLAGSIPVRPSYELGPSPLTTLQLQQLGFIASGYSGLEIAQLRGISPETVKSTREIIVRRLVAVNNNHAMRRAFETAAFIISGTKQPQQTSPTNPPYSGEVGFTPSLPSV